MSAPARNAAHSSVVLAAHGTVVLAAHGTRDPAGVMVARQLVTALRARLPGRAALLAFVDVLGPSIREVVADAPGPVSVVPAFLASGYHVRSDVPREVAATGRSDVTVTAALGPDPLLVSALRDRLRAAGWHSGDAVVLAAAGSSDPRALAEVRSVADGLSAVVGRRVQVGFVAAGAPRVADLVAVLRAAGEHRVAVAAWLLAPGLFHRRLAGTGADVVAAPLGAHPGVVDRLGQLAVAPPRLPGTRHTGGRALRRRLVQHLHQRHAVSDTASAALYKEAVGDRR